MTDDGSSADENRVTTRGPRHAAPRRQLRSRLQLPAGKVLAIAAVPTALLMGAGYTPTLALADDASTKDMAKACATATDTPLQDASPSASADSGKQPAATDTPSATPSPSASAPAAGQSGEPSGGGTPAQSATPSADASAPATGAADAGGTTGQSAAEKLSRAGRLPAASPSPSTTSTTGTTAADARGQGLLGGLLGGVGGLLTGGGSSGGASATPTPSPSATTASATPAPSASSAAPTPSASTAAGGGKGSAGGGSAGGGALDPVGKATAAVSDAEKAVTSVTGKVKGTRDAVTKAAGDAVTSVVSPSPSPSAGQDALCATDASRVAARSDSTAGAVPDQPWTLKSSRLALHGVVFGGVVDITTHSHVTKRVLKFTADSIDIGDLDMSTIEYNKKTTHVKGRAGSTSTMVKGPIVMYTESLTGTLSKVEGLPVPPLGAITLTPDTLPKFLFDLIGAVPIKLELEFTDAKAVQAGQFGGTLHIPGMHLYTDDEPYDG